MNAKIGDLLAQITALEDDLRLALREQEVQLFYHVRGKRIEFETAIRESHRKLKRGLLRWIVTDRPQNFITGPIIYSLALPLLFLDLYVTIYQALCFPIYRIAKARRADYIIFDRWHLEYLNFFERFHCTYCAYANGLLAYTFEIAMRTEQYFCPIKHAHRVLGANARYERFLPYGDAKDYHAKLEEFRVALEIEIPK
ncbi:MAG: hypothetical protein A3H91_03145 [Gammaproteobacteria bacterium RIFCSPLOWO2_02_FULL_61_13]|nr:MAG: hypothetical protein A3H91_03145 [Gammaproteobacteria bacterium RIFCSPLOWO2_02_FULL_61_13]